MILGSVIYWSVYSMVIRMKSFLLVLLAGASCLPATYNLSRRGDIVLAVLVTAIIGAATGVLATVFAGEPKMNFGRLVTAFVAGILLSETASFAHYYTTYGYHDPKLSVGIGVSVVEFGVISAIGSFALIVTMWIMKPYNPPLEPTAKSRDI